MPRDMFGDVTTPSVRLGTRKWYSVPLSFVVHTCTLGALIVAPLIATGTLPTPDTGRMVIDLEPPPLPQPPPVRRARPATPQVNRNAAPTITPDTIAPEPELPEPFESTGPGFAFTDVGTIEGATAVVPPPVKREPPPSKPVPVGGNVKPPQRLNYVAPEYPAIALKARVYGMVIIQATIDANGRVQEARVLRSDSSLLNEAAVAAVRQWVYTPTLLNGTPVSVVMTVTVQFRIH